VKIKLDENIPWDLAPALEDMGQETHSVMSEGLLGSQDPRLLKVCVEEGRVFFTQDLDFARTRDWLKESAGFGVVVCRLNNPSRRALITRIIEVMEAQDLASIVGRLTIVSPSKIRQRELAGFEGDGE
jgi:predicted nuclease of predicted toxin-antitoxin system